MNGYHNPSIGIIEASHPINFTEHEVLIKRLHFIWLGSPLTSSNAKNLPKWVTINDGCEYQIYIWYDSVMLNSDDITPFLAKYDLIS